MWHTMLLEAASDPSQVGRPHSGVWQHATAWCSGLHCTAATHPQVHLPQTAFTSYAGEQNLQAAAERSGMQMLLNESCARSQTECESAAGRQCSCKC